MDGLTIGKKLKELRGNRSASEVAKVLGVSRSALFMYERGERIPRDEVKKKISSYYGKTVGEIFFS